MRRIERHIQGREDNRINEIHSFQWNPPPPAYFPLEKCMDTQPISKELSLCHKLFYKSLYFCNTIFQNMNSFISNNLSLKYQKFTTIGFKDIGIWNFEFVKKTKLLQIIKIHCMAATYFLPILWRGKVNYEV